MYITTGFLVLCACFIIELIIFIPSVQYLFKERNNYDDALFPPNITFNVIFAIFWNIAFLRSFILAFGLLWFVTVLVCTLLI